MVSTKPGGEPSGLLEASNRLSFTQVAQEFGVSLGTIYRWRGKLESWRLGGRWYTTRAALERFIATQTASAPGAKPVEPTDAQQRREAERAGRQLDRMGV